MRVNIVLRFVYYNLHRLDIEVVVVRVKKDKIDLPELGPKDEFGGLDPEELKANQKQINAYMKEARAHLESLKQELYHVIDAGFDDASGYNLKPEETTGVNYSAKPSVFLEKAYTIQAYDEDGRMLENRDQPYIKSGTAFAKYCDSGENNLDADQTLLNDAGRLVGAINSALSQINHVEQSLKKGEFDIAALKTAQIGHFTKAVIMSAENSKIVKVTPNQSGFQKALSGLKNFFSKVGRFFASLGKKQEQIHKEAFVDIKEKYQKAAANPENMEEDKKEISSGPLTN
jgi:hypothetical protein